jgi:hypothetical protein
MTGMWRSPARRASAAAMTESALLARHAAVKSPLAPLPCSENATLRCGQPDGMPSGPRAHQASFPHLPATERHNLHDGPLPSVGCGAEVVLRLQVLEEPGVGRRPAQHLLGERARGWDV